MVFSFFANCSTTYKVLARLLPDKLRYKQVYNKCLIYLELKKHTRV